MINSMSTDTKRFNNGSHRIREDAVACLEKMIAVACCSRQSGESGLQVSYLRGASIGGVPTLNNCCNWLRNSGES